MSNFVLGPNQEKWLTELETTTSRQALNYLHVYKGGYCCLGIGCELFNIPREHLGSSHIWVYEDIDGEGTEGAAPSKLVELLGLYDEEGRSSPEFTKSSVLTEEELSKLLYNSACSLTGLNDSSFTFKEIASIVRRTPEAFFEDSR